VGQRYDPETETLPIAFGAQNSASQGDSVSEHVTPTLDKSKTPAVLRIFQDSQFGVAEYPSAGTIRSGRIPDHQMVISTPAVAFDAYNQTVSDVPTALRASTGGGVHDNTVMQNLQVRRLTPIECERLQGFPDNYTQIPWRNKTPENCPDGPRYKAMGNSMAVPVMHWIGERIQMVDDI
jgi:DNA (cytosine-5)-methyltransferase 1